MLILSYTNGQNLVDTGKTWNVIEWLNYGEKGTMVYSFGADTIIGSNIYKKFIVNSDSGTTGGIGNLPLAAREDTIQKKVYFYRNSSEYLAYDFSLNLTDTFTANYCGMAYELVVDSVDSVMLLNGEMRKRLFLNGLSDEIWIEGIGSMYGLPHMGIYVCSADYFAELNCFTENRIQKFGTALHPNCYYNTVKVDELVSNADVIINPNPLVDYTMVKFDVQRSGTLNLILFNSLGQIRRYYSNVTGSSFKIERGDLSSGIYFLKVECNSQFSGVYKILVQ